MSIARRLYELLAEDGELTIVCHIDPDPEIDGDACESKRVTDDAKLSILRITQKYIIYRTLESENGRKHSSEDRDNMSIIVDQTQ